MQLLCITANRQKVYYDPIESHIATHFHDTPELKKLVEEVLRHANLEQEKEIFEYDFHKVVGKMDLIETTENDEIIYAKRVNRDNFTRFVLNKSPVDTSIVTFILYRQDETSYILHSAWIGKLVPSFPGTETETPESKVYWKNHALIWGTQKIQLGTETTIQPWD